MILVVDDDPQFLDEVKAALTPASERGVFFAGDARQALVLMHQLGSDVSLAMIDLDLPGIDGFALITRMRESFPNVPVIAISGVIRSAALESARAFGATEVLSKPISTEWTAAIERVRRLDNHRHVN